MKGKDEYNEIYLQDGNFGLEYTYKNHYLGKENIIRPNDIGKIGTSKHNEELVFIRCGKCDIHMDYIHSINTSFSGKWVCPKCGTYVKEMTVNKYISKLPNLIDDNNYDDIY